jgi:hypothetical protein
MDTEEKAERKAADDAKKALGDHAGGSNGGGDLPITKSEMKNEMRSMIQELLEMSMIGPRVAP